MLAGNTTLGVENTIKIYPVKTFSSVEAEEAECIGTISLKGKFIADDISLETPYFSVIPLNKFENADAEEGVYTVG